MIERNHKFIITEHTSKIGALYQFANAFAVRMIDACADVSGMSEEERTALFKIYLDGIVEVDLAFSKRDQEIST